MSPRIHRAYCCSKPFRLCVEKCEQSARALHKNTEFMNLFLICTLLCCWLLFRYFFFFSRWMTQRTEHSTHIPYLAFWLVALTAFSACLNSPLMTWWKCDSHPQPTQHHTINLPSGTIENDTWQFSLHHNSHFHFNTNNYFHPNLLNRNGGCYFAFKIQSLNVERNPEGRTVARFALWVIKVRE